MSVGYNTHPTLAAYAFEAEADRYKQAQKTAVLHLRKRIDKVFEQINTQPRRTGSVKTVDFQTVQFEDGVGVPHPIRGWQVPGLARELYMVPELDGVLAPVEDDETTGVFISFASVIDEPETHQVQYDQLEFELIKLICASNQS